MDKKNVKAEIMEHLLSQGPSCIPDMATRLDRSSSQISAAMRSLEARKLVTLEPMMLRRVTGLRRMKMCVITDLGRFMGLKTERHIVAGEDLSAFGMSTVRAGEYVLARVKPGNTALCFYKTIGVCEL